MSDHASFQYRDQAHQSDTAIDGMWLFLATEMLFFGALILTWLVTRHFHQAGFAEAARHSNRLIGTINTALLITSSLALSLGLAGAEAGRARRLIAACMVTFLLGAAFVVLKGIEWHEDFAEHLVPGSGFALTGPDSGGAQLFYCFYFLATTVHAAHMLIGLGLIAWIAWRARRGDFAAGWHTPVEVVALYWSFVDMVWLVLYPVIYLVGRPG